MTTGSMRRVSDTITVTVMYEDADVIKLDGAEFMPLSDVYSRLKKSASDIDIIQRFRNNVRYGKYRIETVENGKGELLRCVNITDPNTTDNTSVKLVFEK